MPILALWALLVMKRMVTTNAHTGGHIAPAANISGADGWIEAILLDSKNTFNLYLEWTARAGRLICGTSSRVHGTRH